MTDEDYKLKFVWIIQGVHKLCLRPNLNFFKWDTLYIVPFLDCLLFAHLSHIELLQPYLTPCIFINTLDRIIVLSEGFRNVSFF